jgi:hypothetical protein
MRMPSSKGTAVIGFRVHTGRATVVALTGTPDKPALLRRGEISLCDPKLPASYQPYHVVLERKDAKAMQLHERAIQAVMRAGKRSVDEFLGGLIEAGYTVRTSAIVVASNPDMAKLHNDHIRAHAAEGILFRRTLEEAAAAAGLACPVWVEKKLAGAVPAEVLAELGRQAGRPWRSQEKAAAAAALLGIMGVDPPR